MHPSHLFQYDREAHHAALLREAEHARLVRLVRPKTGHHLPHWFARIRQMSTRLFWHQAAQRGRAETLAPALPLTGCCRCSC